MGYKYGVWYVYPKDSFTTKHIGHFTVSCFMEKEDARRLYIELLSKMGKSNMINVNCENPVIFENIYEDDDNNICSWGYKGTILNWNSIRKITDNYKCNFSQQPHTSIQYEDEESNLNIEKLSSNKLIKCNIHLVNICSDNPNEWHIIDL
jgi:hypothetical protein|uniref:Uncharacterized protein n=1 Tax=viral metagenome TaxID=1070528 RepID=A0A6C0CXD7_9ZZZZ